MNNKKIIAFLIITVLMSSSFSYGRWMTVSHTIKSGNHHDSRVDQDHPGERDDEPVTFTNISAEAGFAGRSGSHFAWGDYNNDDNSDLLVNGRYLYRNEGEPNYNFTYVSDTANLTGSVSNGVWGDYDNDGFLDIFAGGRADKLFRNNGDETFEDRTLYANLDIDDSPTTAGAWGDYDRDGDLDLYIANGEDWNGGNYIHYPDRFYRNEGDGTFTDATTVAGVDTTSSPHYGRGVTWGDYDNDGWLDLYISNYRLQPNYLWHNNRDGTFSNKAGELGIKGVGRDVNGNQGGNYFGHTIGSSWGDLNNDGRLDLFVSNLVHKDPDRGKFCDDSKLYINNGPTTWDFVDARATSEIPIKPVGGVQGGYYDDENFANAAFADYDNDGDTDLWITQVYNHYWMYSYLYRNNGDLTFTNVAAQLDIDVVDTYAGAWADYDNDGDMDLVTAGRTTGGHPVRLRLFRNEGNDNHWLKIKVMDGADFGVGAQARVYTGSGMIMKQVETGMGSHSSQNDMVLHFGLGGETTIPRIEIIWGDGKVGIMENVNVDQTLEVQKPTDVPLIQTLSAGISEVDEGVPVSFTVGTSRPCPVSWDFDNDGVFDLNTTSGDVPRHTFNISGKYIVKVVAWTDDRMTGSMDTIKLEVHNREPTAVLTGDATGIEDQKLFFSSSATEDSGYDLAIMKYFVDFGDGNTTGWVNHTDYNKTYPVMGTYTVTLTVEDDDGATASTSLRITVSNLLPEPTIMAGITGLEDEEIEFSASCNDTTLDTGHIRYFWDFGDGDSAKYSSSNFSVHTYTESGEYIVTLRVKDRHNAVNTTTHTVNISNIPPTCKSVAGTMGLEDSPISFHGEGFDTESDEEFLMYRWDFGDGSISIWMAWASTEHIYTQAGEYIATLTVRDDDADTGEYPVNVSVANVRPSGDIEIEPLEIYEDDTVTFKGSGEDSGSDEDDLLFRMDFGDGNSTQWQGDPDFSHVYNLSDTYRVTFEIMDNSNATWNTTELVEIKNRFPEAIFNLYPASNIDKTREVRLDASGSVDTISDMELLNYTWSMGTEGKMYGKMIRYTFRTSGKHTIKLTVTDDDGMSSTVTRKIQVANTPPKAVINLSSLKVKAGETVILDGSGSTDTPWDIDELEFEWKIEKERRSGDIIEYVFEDPGTHTVYLTVTDADGDSDEANIRIMVEKGGSVDEGTGSEAWWKLTDEDGVKVGAVIALIFILIAMGLVIGAVLFLSRRKRKREGETDRDAGDLDDPTERFSYPYSGDYGQYGRTGSNDLAQGITAPPSGAGENGTVGGITPMDSLPLLPGLSNMAVSEDAAGSMGEMSGDNEQGRDPNEERQKKTIRRKVVRRPVKSGEQ